MHGNFNGCGLISIRYSDYLQVKNIYYFNDQVRNVIGITSVFLYTAIQKDRIIEQINQSQLILNNLGSLVIPLLPHSAFHFIINGPMVRSCFALLTILILGSFLSGPPVVDEKNQPCSVFLVLWIPQAMPYTTYYLS